LPEVAKCQQFNSTLKPDVLKRNGKGRKIITNIRHLMSSIENWFPITDGNDHHFPGIFTYPHPQRLGYSEDISTLPRYDSHNHHFLFTDIQLGKAKARNVQKVSMAVDGKDETLCYRVVPSGGVRLCPAADCSCVVSTREIKACPQHSTEKLIRFNDSSGECPVEFV
jgi:hypothetical protein